MVRGGGESGSHVEKILSNGDFYTGNCLENLPHGQGKYLWTDGCMYVGEWQKGKTTGKGRFSWPSGATYEGDFKDGHMDGRGTYIGSSGDTYKGSWVMDLRHGKGTQSFPNGDFYDGDGGKGCRVVTVGTNGRVATITLVNGGTEGLPKGNGTFRWGDGSFYVGVWSKDPKEQSGTYYPSGSCAGELEWDPQELYSVDLDECRLCPCEKVAIYPSQKTLNPAGLEEEEEPTFKKSDVNERPRWKSVDGRLSNYSSEDGSSYSYDGSSLGSPLVDPSLPRGPHLRFKPPKRQGETISKGHKNYELMLNLQLGIRHAVGRPAPSTSLDLKSSAFDPKEKVWTKFPSEGSKYTPPHSSCEFKWKDYCPVVFRALRKLFKVDPADYMLSLCGNDALRELSSPGKSGSFFYLTNDDRYMIKTMKKAECKVSSL
ncbi:hypothetical protein PIB30_060840 [Stylosanthes scabra]|uniref:1-phosphatidylinositol-4-phosphate 5-kinase n=1 Tax=Stylosanthes scabra TaxID=79078 RepID=A0ABU6UJG0_9FABA|nr:hypothetical protein [Stylosanthes scabra]